MFSNDTAAFSLSTSQGQTVCCASVIISLSRSPVPHYSWQTAETEVAPLKACGALQPSMATLPTFVIFALASPHHFPTFPLTFPHPHISHHTLKNTKFEEFQPTEEKARLAFTQ